MANLKDTGKAVENRLMSFLADKPLWAWLVAYVVIVGLLFLVFWIIYRVLTISAWISILIIIVAGVIWGAIEYTSKKPRPQ